MILLKRLTKAMEMFQKRSARENTSIRNIPNRRTRRNTKKGNINLDPEHVHNLVQDRVHVPLKEDTL